MIQAGEVCHELGRTVEDGLVAVEAAAVLSVLLVLAVDPLHGAHAGGWRLLLTSSLFSTGSAVYDDFSTALKYKLHCTLYSTLTKISLEKLR